jgi:predicted glycosyltransferase
LNTGRPRGRRLRILLHSQHLTGVGHFVRMREIARVLTPHHEVYMVDGGRPVPGSDAGGATPVELPRIIREEGRLAPLSGEPDIAATLAERRRILCDAITRLRPDVLIVEHYPFSKWELQGEIEAAIAAARAASARAVILCSVRDIVRQTRHESCAGPVYVKHVLDSLHAGFDALLVHGDPALTRLEDHFPGAGSIRIPVEYTGIVSEIPRHDQHAARALDQLTGGSPFVLASAGGGPDAQGLLLQCVHAWRLLVAQDALPGWKLVICPGLASPPGELHDLAAADGIDGIFVQPFSPDYLAWLEKARLSVSCAGYNTCANLLQLGCLALLVPDPQMSDQPERARILAARGIASMLDARLFDAKVLANAIRTTLATSPAPHDIALDGAERTRAIIERLAG